jgi:hypothetical protein
MKLPLNRKELITILFSIAIFLLLANIILSKVLGNSGNQKRSELYSLEVKDKFISALHNFGIKDEWIIENKKGIKEDDSLKYNFKVNVPKDLPVSLLLNEITNIYGPGEISYFSKETKVNGTTNLYLVSGGYEKLTAEFVYNPDIHHPSCSVGFFIYGINALDTISQSQIIKMPETFTVVLLPSKESIDIIKRLKPNEKNYTVMLSSNINDLDYKLSGSYSNERLKMSVRSLLGDFSDAIGFQYNGNSGFSSDSKFPFIKQEFERRNVKFIDINKFELIDEKETPLNNSFESIMNQTSENKTPLIYISADHYLKIKPLISKYRKIGYKFINPGSVVTDLQKPL